MKTVVTTLGMLISLTLFGTVGFYLVRDVTWLHALYLAVITLTTLGSEDPGIDPPSQLFVIFYLITGLGIFTFSAFQFGSWIVSAEFQQVLKRRKMQQRINQLSGHSIVCGQGRMGLAICDYLADRKRPFVVIDSDEDRVANICQEKHWPFVAGDATDDDVLRAAGIERADSLTTVLATDSDNLYVVITARILNTRLKIIARASDEKAIKKLERAGATRVVSPFSTGAVKMARFMLNPSIEDFIEIADAHGSELELADIQVNSESPYVGKQLMQTDLRNRGVMVIGIRRANGERLMPPPGSAVLNAGDSLFVFGNSEAVNAILGEAAE